MNNQRKKPLYQALTHHAAKNPISFHVPGHKNGEAFPKHNEFQQLLKLDVTELSGLDDLHAPEGVIKEAEALLAEVYKVKKSFFLVNGSTVGNLAMILAAVQEDEVVLVQRNCHKSVLNALTIAKARPVFLEPEYDQEWGVSTGISEETLTNAITQYPGAKALIVTYPNYYGRVYNLKDLIKLAHLHNIPVLVDEAHGPHFIIGEPFPLSAIECGADVIVQSAHKTLPAMTMGSFLHINTDRVSLSKIKNYLSMLQSSSPSYVIMASLDLARSYIAEYEQKDLEYLKRQISFFKKEIRDVPSIKVLDYPDSHGDLLKLTIQSNCGLSGFDLQKRIEAAGIYTELADTKNVLFIFPLLKNNQVFPLDETITKIKQSMADIPAEEKREGLAISSPVKITELVIAYYQMASFGEKNVEIPKAIDKVSAETVIPYPPGIPLLLRGERITEGKLQQLNQLRESGARFQGGASLDKGLIRVFKTE